MSQPSAEEYFVHIAAVHPVQAPVAPATQDVAAAPSVRAAEIRLADSTARTTATIGTVLLAALGVVAGIAVPLGLWLVAQLLSIGFGPVTHGDVSMFVVIGVMIFVTCMAGAVETYRIWHRPENIHVGDAGLTIHYIGFSRPLIVPKELIRVVAIDDQPTRLFRQNHRFPVTGSVPPEEFADALDVYPRSPWSGPTTDDRRGSFPIPSPLEQPETPYLFGPEGSALPFCRINPEDVPNVAILFQQPVATPRAPFMLDFMRGCSTVFRGGRKVRGVLVRAVDASAAANAFAPWNVVRDVTADDVTDEHLLLPKPLRGWRAVAYAAIILMPMVIRMLARHHF